MTSITPASSFLPNPCSIVLQAEQHTHSADHARVSLCHTQHLHLQLIAVIRPKL